MACFSVNPILQTDFIIIFVIQPPSSSKRLSPPACQFREPSVLVCMAFDPLKSNYYKLIYGHPLGKTNKYHIYIYSLEADSWSPLGITPPNRVDFSDVVFCNGAVHWYSHCDKTCFNTMPMPKLRKPMVHYFGESRGHLHLIETEFPYPSQFDVSETAADYSGWYVRYHVNLDAVRTAFPDLIWFHRDKCRFSVLDEIRAQKEEDSMVVVLVDKKAISYNVHDGTSKKLYDLEYEVKTNYSWRGTFPYFESLASV